MMSHLAILVILCPLLAAPLCLLLNRTYPVWLMAVFACIASFIISILILFNVTEHSDIYYALGGWQAPIGIALHIDELSAYLLLIVSGLSTVVICASKASIEQELNRAKPYLFYVLFLLCLSGMLGIIASGDVFNVFIFIEISALSSYALIALGRDRRALSAAFNYLLVGTLGATFILIGIGLMYMATGTLNMQDLFVRLAEQQDSRTLLTAFCFFIVGVCLKLALFPLHWWLPRAYAFAPSIVSTFLAATATKVAIYILLRFVFSVFGQAFSFAVVPLQDILLTLGVAGILSASLMAIYQENIKQLFAYSSIAQIGYIMLSFGLNSTNGLMASLLHLFNHALMKGALFLALAAVVFRTGSSQIEHFSGLAKQMPWTMAAMVISCMSLVGMPLTVGFISKWYMLTASIESGWWLLAGIILLGSLLSIIYVWRIIETAYFQPVQASNVQAKEAPLSLLMPVWILTLANIYFGIDSRLTVSVSHAAIQSLVGGM